MKELVFKPGTRNVTIERTSAIAWATNRRGRNPWKGNVTSEIRNYLAAQGYQPDLSRRAGWVQTTLQSIEANGFGYLKREPADPSVGGRAGATTIIEFNFHDDIDLNGHGLPAKATVELSAQKAQLERFRGPGYANDSQTERLIHDFPSAATTLEALGRPVVQSTGVMPPLPGVAVPPPYGLDHLVQLLTDWSHKAPEDYAKWIEAATEVLEGVV
jgi:hypothetical protein